MEDRPVQNELISRLTRIRLNQLVPNKTVMDLKVDFIPHDVSAFARQSESDMEGSKFLSNHHYFILLLAYDGTGQYELDDKTYHITPGTVFLTFPFQVHCYSEISEEISWLYFRFEAEHEALVKHLRHSPRQTTSELTDKALALLNEIEHQDSWKSPLKASLATVDLIECLQKAPAKKGLKKDSEDNDVLKQHVHKHVMANITDAIHVSDIADTMGISTSYLRTLFKRYYGISVGKFILKQKITHACHLILSTSMQMQDIADACGFGTAFSFSRAFKRMMCLTPREYRDWFHVK